MEADGHLGRQGLPSTKGQDVLAAVPGQPRAHQPRGAGRAEDFTVERKVVEMGVGDERTLAGVPGVDFDYEAPADAELTIPLHELGAPDVALRTAVERVMALLEGRGVIVK
jgi:hypothetical protein